MLTNCSVIMVHSRFLELPFNYSLLTEVLSYRSQSIDLFRKSIDRFLYDGDLRHERINYFRVIKCLFKLDRILIQT